MTEELYYYKPNPKFSDRVDGDIDDLLKLKKKKGSKPPSDFLQSRDDGMNKLASLVVSKLHMDVSRNKKMSNVVSAQNYIDTRNPKLAGKFRKDGKPKLSGYEGWKAEQRDIDNDNILDNIVVDKNGILRYVEGYNVSDRNIPLYQLQQEYYSAKPSIDNRKNTNFNAYKSSLRDERGLQNLQDVWKFIFDRYMAYAEKEDVRTIIDYPAMLKTRVRMYLYKLFQIYLFREVGIITNNTALNVAETKIKDVMGSSRAKDEILKRCRTILTDEELKNGFIGKLFLIFDTKVSKLVNMLLNDYSGEKRITAEGVNELIFGDYSGDGKVGDMEKE
jgi:hypothetical protein